MFSIHKVEIKLKIVLLRLKTLTYARPLVTLAAKGPQGPSQAASRLIPRLGAISANFYDLRLVYKLDKRDSASIKAETARD